MSTIKECKDTAKGLIYLSSVGGILLSYHMISGYPLQESGPMLIIDDFLCQLVSEYDVLIHFWYRHLNSRNLATTKPNFTAKLATQNS